MKVLFFKNKKKLNKISVNRSILSRLDYEGKCNNLPNPLKNKSILEILIQNEKYEMEKSED